MLLKERGFLVSRRGRTLRLGSFVVLQVEQDWLGLLGRLTLLAAQFENIAPQVPLIIQDQVRLTYLKDAIENKGCHRLFYVAGQPVKREVDLQIMYRLVWVGTPSDVTTEANDGRGPADFKISRGARDKTIVELTLASNSQLRNNLQKQAEIYMKASDAANSLKGILFFTREEGLKVAKILNELKLANDESIILIDARSDNKPSGSKARA
jgi:hypothetical protein